MKDRDFIVFQSGLNNPQGGRPRTDYHLTLRMAAHLALMENTERGMKVRDYCLEALEERDRLRKREPAQPGIPDLRDTAVPLPLLKDYSQNRRLLNTATPSSTTRKSRSSTAGPMSWGLG